MTLSSRRTAILSPHKSFMGPSYIIYDVKCSHGALESELASSGLAREQVACILTRGALRQAGALEE